MLSSCACVSMCPCAHVSICAFAFAFACACGSGVLDARRKSDERASARHSVPEKRCTVTSILKDETVFD